MSKSVAIIMAAGKSTRMKTTLPKVMHKVSHRPMLAYVLDACRQAGIEKMVVVVGYGKEIIMDAFKDDQDIVWVEQTEQLGTGHAVMCCEDELKDFDGQTIVLCGDGPLIQSQSLDTLISTHSEENAQATLITAMVDDPKGYGRIYRDPSGKLLGIVEHNDCTDEQLKICEINPSYYCFDNQLLFELLKQVKPDNAKGEYYVTDVLKMIIDSGKKAVAIEGVDPEDVLSVNSRDQLVVVNKMMQQRVQRKLMASGVTIIDPETTWLDNRVEIGQDTIIEPFTYIEGPMVVPPQSRIGPFAYYCDGQEQDFLVARKAGV